MILFLVVEQVWWVGGGGSLCVLARNARVLRLCWYAASAPLSVRRREQHWLRGAQDGGAWLTAQGEPPLFQSPVTKEGGGTNRRAEVPHGGGRASRPMEGALWAGRGGPGDARRADNAMWFIASLVLLQYSERGVHWGGQADGMGRRWRMSEEQVEPRALVLWMGTKVMDGVDSDAGNQQLGGKAAYGEIYICEKILKITHQTFSLSCGLLWIKLIGLPKKTENILALKEVCCLVSTSNMEHKKIRAELSQELKENYWQDYQTVSKQVFVPVTTNDVEILGPQDCS